jgi:MFS-type transporter involved in bile tolerance (Atg22 family)
MGKQKRGLFQHDLGEHPPPIHEFLELHRTDYRSGRHRWALWPKMSAEELRTNQRSFGWFLIVFSVFFPALVFAMAHATAREVASGSQLSVAIVSVASIAIGAMMIRVGRRHR